MISTSLAVPVGYFATYLLILATPGPNVLATGGFAALHGFGATLPLAAGVGLGAAAQGFVFFAGVGLLPSGGSWEVAGRGFSALLLAMMGWRALRSGPRLCSAASLAAKWPTDWRTDLTIGFCTASSNPITGLFFAAQFVGPAGDLPWFAGFPLLAATGIFAFIWALTVAAMFSQDAIRRRVVSALPVWSRIIAGLFLVLACLSIWPVARAIAFH